MILKTWHFFDNIVIPDVGGISVRSSTNIKDFDCGITCGDSSYVGMTNFTVRSDIKKKDVYKIIPKMPNVSAPKI
ncbi:hypothetical protein [Flavobacterium aquicola]|uniref:Uncharacterized protein n=1 Tax=Flavobacterium aquicola TaxID=1682742 RepID=A0A3E0EUA6_9FLAO|nr:hypothetical protein [Flavobacterium aquicola]REH01709.1 hypothetical protein C8P67_101190 [Flavobacterium aquicola]